VLERKHNATTTLTVRSMPESIPNQAIFIFVLEFKFSNEGNGLTENR
jgi:hypothetical protein